MSDEKKTITIRLPNGKEVEVEKLGVTKSEEGWNRYELENGVFLNLKTIVYEVYKTVKEKDPTTGKLMYITRSHNILKEE